MNTQDLFNEYAGCYRVVDNCEDDGYGCKMCIADKERMQEIIKEVEELVRKEVIEDIIQKERMRSLDFIDDLLYWEENKGIEIK